MNIFILSLFPDRCAKYHCDKHLVKMIVETAQLLSTAHRILDNNDSDLLYKKTHENHPCAKWIRETTGNYKYASELGVELCKEYKYRYGKIHKTTGLAIWLNENIPHNLKNEKRTNFVLAMPEELKSNKPIKSYRDYVFLEKSHLHKWSKREIPNWINIRRNLK